MCLRVERGAGLEGLGVEALGFRGIEAREKRKRGRSGGMFVCVHGVRACKRQLRRRNSSASTA